MPPAEFREIFAPILRDFLAGCDARQKLLSLIKYSIELQIAVQEFDAAMGDKYAPIDDHEAAK